ncbi:MAG: nucleoside 2-deoxyribosyltransferase [Candidatus Omnitrophica bacterium]|nr:nucleoside 2-deoxyribosyltransferase [Candidatus Omnitrophota bacterium]
MRIFIASPLGFYESGRLLLPILCERLRDLGVTPVNPWDASQDLEQKLREAQAIPDPEARRRNLHAASMQIAERNASLLQSCDGVLAVLDGCDVDSGTASEIGFAFGLGNKIIHGFRSDFRRSGENDGVHINLQVEYWIEKSGGKIVFSLEELNQLPFTKKDQ